MFILERLQSIDKIEQELYLWREQQEVTPSPNISNTHALRCADM